ncbi:MAG: putative signal peptidase [Nitrososphaeraceae archaeon]|jgi:signal peptidase|nr:putative signal peptidase [Nitrososphaeraceae archaeon]MDP8915385.1 signal peptidase I [Thermoproteota archaeon]HZB73623.1 signal peptidase I [Nitrososphaeraceae archaeon]
MKELNLLKKNESRVPSIIKDVVIVVIGVAIIWLGLRFVFDTGNPFYVVSSGSMVPNLNVNDILVVRDGNSFQDLKVGDIIVFDRPDGADRVIVHRVAEIFDDSEGNHQIIRTKGDANDGSIPGTDFPIREDDYIGKVAYVIPGAGVVTKILSPPVNYIIIAAIIALMVVTQISKRKNNDNKNNQSQQTTSEETDNK